MRRLLSASILIAAPLALTPLWAGGAEKLGLRDAPAPFSHATTDAVSDWAARSQLVWNEAEETLERRSYEIWRTAAEAGLTFTWHPADLASDQVGRINGQGRVVWRRIDVADYDPASIVATYEGALVDGYRHGRGVYSRRDGLVYDGEWRRGQMHGTGEISLPNGDHYKGPFVDGAPHGDGLYVDAEGVIYRGGFSEGLRDGVGVVHRPDDLIYKATWSAGAEAPGTRENVATPELRYAALEDEVTVRVTVENLYNATEQDFKAVSGDASTFRTRSNGETLIVRPGNPRIEDVWRGRSPIHLAYPEELGRGSGGGFLGIKPDEIKPASLVFEFENRSRDDMKIVGAYLDVVESARDLSPMLHVSRGLDSVCLSVRPKYDPNFHLENFGWGPVDRGVMNLQFVDEEGVPVDAGFEVDISGLDGPNTISVTDQLRAYGADPNRMQRGFDCSVIANAAGQQVDQLPLEQVKRACGAVLRDSGAFGRIAHAVEVGSERVFLNVRGSLDYSWRAADGQSQRSASSFKTKVSLGEIIFSTPECGEGAEPEALADKPYKFEIGRTNYRIRIRLRDTVPAGVAARWRVRLDADENSTNIFRMVFTLADGRRVASRPIDMMLIRPRFYE